MTTQNGRRSAQIIPFPASGARGRGGGGAKAETKQKSQIFENSTSVCGGAWYHETAIAETDRLRKP